MLSIELKKRQDAALRAERLKKMKNEFKKRMSLNFEPEDFGNLGEHRGSLSKRSEREEPWSSGPRKLRDLGFSKLHMSLRKFVSGKEELTQKNSKE